MLTLPENLLIFSRDLRVGTVEKSHVITRFVKCLKTYLANTVSNFKVPEFTGNLLNLETGFCHPNNYTILLTNTRTTQVMP